MNLILCLMGISGKECLSSPLTKGRIPQSSPFGRRGVNINNLNLKSSYIIKIMIFFFASWRLCERNLALTNLLKNLIKKYLSFFKKVRIIIYSACMDFDLK
jgi:hypothetical protein